MGFSGLRAIVMIAVLTAMVLAVTKLDLPGWILPVGLIVAGIAMKTWEQRATA